MTITKEKNTKQNIRSLRMDNDYLFKSLFRSIEAREMVAKVLSKITGLDEEILLNADYIGGEIPKKKEQEKLKMSDVIVKIEDNFRIIVEMNGSYYPNLYRKNASYAFANYIEYTPIGGETKNTVYPNIILVNIDVVNHFKTKSPVSIFEIRNDEGEIEADSYKSYHFILANALNPEYNKDKYLYQFALFMKANNINNLKEIANGNEYFEKAFRKVEEYMSDKDFLIYYDKEEMDKYEKEEMKKYGLEIGLEQGLEQGRAKLKTIIENMISKGMTITEVSKLTDITEDEINSLLN